MARICMVVVSHYPDDPRPRREAEALVDAGHEVEIICLKKKGQPSSEVIHGVKSHRLPVYRKRAGKFRYIWDYLHFMILATLKLSWLHIWRHFHLIHIHNMPDVLVFTALLPRLTGSRILLDLHDPTPEVYQTKFAIDPHGRVFGLLTFLEQLSIRFSHAVITPNITFRNLFISRGCPARKIGIVMNSPQESVFPCAMTFQEPPAAARDKDFIVMFHGGLYERHGIDTALMSMARIHTHIPNLRFHVFGDGDYREQFINHVREWGLEHIVSYFGAVPIERIVKEISCATIGLIPNKKTPFTDINFPTRIFEYLCMNRPVIAPATKGILDYFKPDELFFFEPEDVDSLAEVLTKAWQQPALAEHILHKGQLIYRRHQWTDERQTLASIVNNLLSNNKDENKEPVLNQNR